MTSRLLWACLLAFLPATFVVAEESAAPRHARLLVAAAPVATTRAPFREPMGLPVEVRTEASDATGPAPTGEETCLLQREVSSQANSARCLSCHGGTFGRHTSHPVDVDYEAAGRRWNGSVRAMDEAVRRGAFLPEGQVRCTSCHDGRSTFAHHISLPPGVEVRPAVHLSDPRTYETESRAVARVGSRLGSAQVPEGYEVAVRPLCLACHPMD
jgi:Cytochrome c7 and related cytochrome c